MTRPRRCGQVWGRPALLTVRSVLLLLGLASASSSLTPSVTSSGGPRNSAPAFLLPGAPTPIQAPSRRSRPCPPPRLPSSLAGAPVPDPIVVPYEAMVTGPHVERLKREAQRRARQLALQRRLGRLYRPLLGWMDGSWEKRWRAYAEEGGLEADTWASVLMQGQQQGQGHHHPAAEATWVVEGPVLPKAVAGTVEGADDAFVLLSEPAQGNPMRRWLVRGWRRLRRGRQAEEEVEEWGLYRRGEAREQLGRIGLKLRRPRGRALTDLERAAGDVFGPEAGHRPAPLIIVVFCFVPLEHRGRGYGERMISLAARRLLGGECSGAGGFVMLTADDNGSGRLVQYYERQGFRLAPALSSSGCDVLLRWVRPPAADEGKRG